MSLEDKTKYHRSFLKKVYSSVNSDEYMKRLSKKTSTYIHYMDERRRITDEYSRAVNLLDNFYYKSNFIQTVSREP